MFKSQTWYLIKSIYVEAYTKGMKTCKHTHVNTLRDF